MEFLHISLLKQILQWQRPTGCFGKMPKSHLRSQAEKAGLAKESDYEYDDDNKEDDQDDQQENDDKKDETGAIQKNQNINQGNQSQINMKNNGINLQLPQKKPAIKQILSSDYVQGPIKFRNLLEEKSMSGRYLLFFIFLKVPCKIVCFCVKL